MTRPTAADPFHGIPLERMAGFERLLGKWARDGAVAIAGLYERADPAEFPGLHRLGNQMRCLIEEPTAQFDFQGVVTRNPTFWQAAQELSEVDSTFTYFVAMLAVLGGDQVTASRLLALAQATLPLTPEMRRHYAQGEALLWFQENHLVRGIPVVTAVTTAAECEVLLAAIRLRVARWPRSKVLLQALVDYEVRKVELLAVAEGRALVGKRRLRELAGLSAPELDFARKIDPIWTESMECTVDQWRRRETLVQQWIKWTYDFEPAEALDLDHSVTVFESSGRVDLAWLTWRHAVMVHRLPRREVRLRQRAWLDQLVGPEAAMTVAVAIDRNVLAGTASLPVPSEGTSEAWTGDLGIHPLLAITVERQLAVIDAQVATVGSDPRALIRLWIRRAEILCDIGAPSSGRRELEQLRNLVPDVRGYGDLRAALEDAIAYVEMRILWAELRFSEAALALEQNRDPRRPAEYVRTRAELAYGAGDFGKAREMYIQLLAMAKAQHAYWAIMADLAARRQGGRETAALERILPVLAKNSWEAAGIQFMLGQMSADELMDRAKTSGKVFDSVQHECEGAFWVAQVALADGRLEEGIAWLRRCMATGYTTFVEYLLAKAELKRLEPEKAKPPRRHEGRSLLGVSPA